MLKQISLHPLMQGPIAAGRALSKRARAVPLRQEMEEALGAGHKVVLDFDGIEATQSFVDELVGVLILKQGPSILESISFRKCSANMKAIVQFVASDRAAQYSSQEQLATLH